MSVEIVSLIYKSIDYLNFIYNQLNLSNINYRIVANDANDNVLKALNDKHINHSVYNDPKTNDYYLNRVYRCWNYCATSSNYDLICFVNSDMAFSEGWLESLLKAHNEGFLPTSRLVESGKMISGQHGISKDFGRNPREFDKNKWNKFVEATKIPTKIPGGLYMPVIFNVKEFINCGMYPEGNIYKDGAGTLNGNVIESGDSWFFKKFCNKTGRKHITCFDSLVYHIQEGEKDD